MATISHLNIINAIDNSILLLRRIKRGDNFNNELKTRLSEMLNFIRDLNNQNYQNAIYSKGIYINKESLDKFHDNITSVNIEDSEIDDMLMLIGDDKKLTIDEINSIQNLLTRISKPLLSSLNANA